MRMFAQKGIPTFVYDKQVKSEPMIIDKAKSAPQVVVMLRINCCRSVFSKKHTNQKQKAVRTRNQRHPTMERPTTPS